MSFQQIRSRIKGIIGFLKLSVITDAPVFFLISFFYFGEKKDFFDLLNVFVILNIRNRS